MTDPTPTARPTLTSDIDQFVSELRDGDVLLFHKLHIVSHIIKLVDNSPVNHCALYRSTGQKMVHASFPIEKHGMAVRACSLRDRLGKREDRTVTALRLCEKDIGANVLQQADKWLSETTRYRFKALPSLAAQCINRSYGNTVDARERALLSHASQAISSMSAADDRDKLSVTCSEFVYSCYIAADPHSIHIHDPLSVRMLDGRHAARYFTHEPPPGLEFRNPGGSSTPAPRQPTSGRGFDDILRNERYALHQEMLKNDKQGKQLLVAYQDRPPYAQTITPFDLWQSPSLTAVHVLHLPPVKGDPIYKRTGRAFGGS